MFPRLFARIARLFGLPHIPPDWDLSSRVGQFFLAHIYFSHSAVRTARENSLSVGKLGPRRVNRVTITIDDYVIKKKTIIDIKF